MIKTIIVDHILPGTIIYTDRWRAYDGAIKEINEDLHMYLQHFTVNHCETFKNDEGICTNGIEGKWNEIFLIRSTNVQLKH